MVGTADLIARYALSGHPENGLFQERNDPAPDGNRAPSGLIYYAVRPGERTQFHQIDCEEYWCYHAGATLELWHIDRSGVLHRSLLGTQPGAEPVIRLAAGEIFASRLPKTAKDGTFLSCITVPRFSYDGFTLFSEEEIVSRYPETEAFFREEIQ